MNILIIEPFFSGSHKSWITELKHYSRYTIEVLSLPGRHWKWRMSGGAITLAKMYNDHGFAPDLILVSDMLDVATFLSLTRKTTCHVPIAIYFHENQLTYPWSEQDRDIENKRDHHYVFKNFTSALCADAVYFNSAYHMDSFLNSLPAFLKQFPDYNELKSVEEIKAKSSVLYLGLDLKKFNEFKCNCQTSPPLLLWNHRWEYDKNPEDFFNAILTLDQRGIDFQVAVLGEKYAKYPKIFDIAKEKLKDKIIAFGYCETFEEYAKWLWKADIIPVTNNQDFFGISIMEAVYCNTIPLLPERLTYPELFMHKKNKNLFYRDFKELVTKLEEIMHNIFIYKNNIQQLVAIAEQYYWGNSIQTYDEVFRNLSKSK